MSEDPFSKTMHANYLSSAEEYTPDCLTSLLSTTSYSSPSRITKCNCNGYTTTTSICGRVAELTSVTVKTTSTVGCPSTTTTVSLVPITAATISVLTTTIKESCDAMPMSPNSLEIRHIAIASGVLTAILVMIVAALLVVGLFVVCLYIKIKKQCRCMRYIMLEGVPVDVYASIMHTLCQLQLLAQAITTWFSQTDLWEEVQGNPLPSKKGQLLWPRCRVVPTSKRRTCTTRMIILIRTYAYNMRTLFSNNRKTTKRIILFSPANRKVSPPHNHFQVLTYNIHIDVRTPAKYSYCTSCEYNHG